MLKPHFIVSAFTIISVTATFAQEKNLSLRVYADPNICQSYSLKRVFHNSNLISSNFKKNTALFFGAGLELQKELKNRIKLAGSIAFISKGAFSTQDSSYLNGNLSGYGFHRTDLSFFEATIFIEKQILLKDPKYRLLVSSGMFYGLPAKLGNKIPDPHGHDLGISIAMGAMRKKVFTKLDFRKGIINIDNDTNARFKSTVLSITIGYIIF